MDITPELIEKVKQYAMVAVKPERFQHSIRVGETARLMCRIYGVDPVKGYFAGIAHDMCKDLDDEIQISLASHDGAEFTKQELKKPALLHGRAAAIKLEKDFGVDDREILEAVAKHTLGGKGLCSLSKIIYVADKVEPGRPHSTEEYRSELFALPLNTMCLKVLEENMNYLKKKNKSVADVSYKFLEDLKELSLAEKKGSVDEKSTGK